MHLTSADKRAVQDGFKFLVVAGGQRKCYCTTVQEAKREAGKGGKIVVLGKMRYTTQNPRSREISMRRIAQKLSDESTGTKEEDLEYRAYLGAVYSGKYGLAERLSASKGGKQAKIDLIERSKKRNPKSSRKKLTQAYQQRQQSRGAHGYSKMDPCPACGKRRAVEPMVRDEYEGTQWYGDAICWSCVNKERRKLGLGPLDTEGMPIERGKKRNPSGKRYVQGGHDFTNDTYPKSLFPWEVAFKKVTKLTGVTVDDTLPFMDEKSARQWASSPSVKKAGYRPYAVRLRNPSKKAKLASLDREIARREEMGLPVAHLLEQRDLRGKKRNPTWLTTALLAGGAYAYGRSETVRASVHSLARAAGAGAKHAAEKAKQAADEYSKKRESAKENPGLTPAGKRHLIKTMQKAGADTFKKKVAYVRRHMPHITDPQAFVGYVVKGER